MRRRTYLRTVSSVSVASIAGCGDVLGGGASVDDLTVAYVPIYPNLQHFVMADRGYYDELPVEVRVERFDSGPAVVQAFASGEVDAALFGVTPAMVLRDRGVPARVVAANSRDGFKLVGTNRLADLYEDHGQDAFDRFADAEGRRPRIGAPPDGSVPDVILRYWAADALDVADLESAVRKSQLPPARVPQSMQSGDLDAAVIQEPFATVLTGDEAFRELWWSGEVVPDHPVTVTFAHDRLVDGAPDVAEALVEQHRRATRLANESPEEAAAHAAEVMGDGVDVDLARRAMDSRASDFVSDPRVVAEQADEMAEYVAAAGTTESVVPSDDLFDRGVYESVANGD